MNTSIFLSSTGMLLGIGTGAVANLFRNGGSLFARGTRESCKNTPFSGNRSLQMVNNTREVIPLIYLNIVTKEMINLYNIYHSRTEKVEGILGLCKVYWNRCFHRTEKETGILGFCKVYWNKHCKSSILEKVRNITILLTGLGIKFCIDTKYSNSRIDISGHTIAQTIFTVQTIQILKTSEKHDSSRQKTALKALTIAIGITDMIGMYNTTSNCHSVADVISGVALGLGSNYAASFII